MNRKNTKAKISYKSIIFWSLIGVLTLGFTIGIIVSYVKNSSVASYERVDHLVGQDLYTQSNDTYLVFIYDSTADYETLDENMFNYFSYAKANKNKEGVHPIYCFDLNNTQNKKCIANETKTNGTTTFPINGITAGSDTSVLKIESSAHPILVVVSSGKITNSYDSPQQIRDYLQGIIDA